MAIDRDAPTARSLTTLDWLRGIAAVCVMFYHYFQHGPLHVLFSRAFLAVDFFFMLSGFVLAHRYGTAIPRTPGTWTFLAARLRRLYPLYIAGTLLGGAVLWFDIKVGRTTGFRWTQWEASGALAIFFQPYLGHFVLAVGSGRIDAPAFPFNVPAWSLFFELIANTIMGLAVLSVRRLLLMVGSAFVLLCSADLFYRDTNVGWGFEEFSGGLPRVMFGFFVGVLLQRLYAAGSMRLPKVPAGVVAALLALDLCVPTIAHIGIAHYLFSIAVLFPAIVLMGARSSEHVSNGGILAFLGRISFALYMVHYPIMTWSDIVTRRIGMPIDALHQGFVVALSAAAALAVASALTLWFDEPLRRMMRRRSAAAGTLTPLASGSPSRP